MLEDDAISILDAALRKLIGSLAPEGLQTRALPPAAMAAAATATALAQQAIAADNTTDKLTIAIAAGYAASYFGLPRNNLLDQVNIVCGMFAMTANQRGALHQQGAAILQSYVMSLKKGNSMNGVLGSVYKDGVLGMIQNGAFRDGSLGRAMLQNGAFRDGSLGTIMRQNGAFRDGSLGASLSTLISEAHRKNPNWTAADTAAAVARYNASRGGWASAASRSPMIASGRVRNVRKVQAQMRGLGGCGCAGIGDDALPAATALPTTTTATTTVTADTTPFYKKPLVIGGVAVALGVVLYAVTKK